VQPTCLSSSFENSIEGVGVYKLPARAFVNWFVYIVGMYVYMYVYMCICMYVSMYLYVYACEYVCVHRYVYVCIYV
jgi:hypothetical protein